MLKTKPFLVILLINCVILFLAFLIDANDSERVIVVALTALVLAGIELFAGIVVAIVGKSGSLTTKYGIALMQNSGLILLLSLALCSTMGAF